MGAACYLCALGYGTIPDAFPGDAVGACKLCGVLACLAHGMRDKSVPAYQCGCCVVGLLATAARRQTGDDPPAPPAPPGGDGTPPPGSPPGFAIRAHSIDTVEDVIVDFSEPRWDGVRSDMAMLERDLAGAGAPAVLRAFSRPQAARARRLLAAAIAVAAKLELPGDEVPAMVAALLPERRNG